MRQDNQTQQDKDEQEFDENVLELVDTLQSIDTSKLNVKLNETSVADNNGSRIIL
jgi:(p)ppGpp synthase/HD superfamily hydrolase